MLRNINSSQQVSFDSTSLSAWENSGNQPKKTPKYPKTTAGVIRNMRKDLKKDYQFFIKDKKIKEIRITKIDKKKGVMHLWVHKTDRTQIPRILGLLREYPFKHTRFPTGAATGYVFKCTVEVNPTNIPKGIVVLN
jgi:hypothetical protein